MPKLKTHKGTSKRVRVTKGGKLLPKTVDSKINGSASRTIRRALGI